MKRKQFTQEQNHASLRELEAGAITPELCGKYGIVQNAFYRCKTILGGIELSDIHRLKEFEDEKSRLR